VKRSLHEKRVELFRLMMELRGADRASYEEMRVKVLEATDRDRKRRAN